MVSILHKNEIGLGLQVQPFDHKLGVKPDNSGNIQFEVSEAGLRGNIELPQAFDPSTLQQQIAALEQAKQAAETKANELQNALDTEKAKVVVLENKVTALENREDLHASNLSLDDATNEVVLTINNDAELRVGLGKFLNVIPTSQAVWDEIKALPSFKADLLAILKGEEVQDFSGHTKGFLLPSA